MTSGEQEADWRLVLDANVLLQTPVRDTLLRLAQEEIITVFWSDSILAEVERNFPRVSGAVDASRRYGRLLGALRHHFPRALVAETGDEPGEAWGALHDRHVLACALAAPAKLIVTYNIRHFPARLLAPYAILAWHPDTLLFDVLEQRPDEVREVLLAQGAELHPPRSLARVLDRLAHDLPQFATRARRRFGLE